MIKSVAILSLCCLVIACKTQTQEATSSTSNDSKTNSESYFGLREAIQHGQNARKLLAYNEKWPAGYSSTRFFELIEGNQNLKDISFCFVEFDSLPNSIGTLSNLEELAIQSSGITYIPDGIGRLKKLKKLDFGNTTDECGGSPIKWISPEIGQCESLEILNLAFSQIDGLPSSLVNCKRLKEIDLSFTPNLSDSTFQKLKLQFPKVVFMRLSK